MSLVLLASLIHANATWIGVWIASFRMTTTKIKTKTNSTEKRRRNETIGKGISTKTPAEFETRQNCKTVNSPTSHPFRLAEIPSIEAFVFVFVASLFNLLPVRSFPFPFCLPFPIEDAIRITIKLARTLTHTHMHSNSHSDTGVRRRIDGAIQCNRQCALHRHQNNSNNGNNYTIFHIDFIAASFATRFNTIQYCCCLLSLTTATQSSSLFIVDSVAFSLRLFTQKMPKNRTEALVLPIVHDRIHSICFIFKLDSFCLFVFWFVCSIWSVRLSFHRCVDSL